MAPSYSGSGAVVPSGLVAPEQLSSTSAKYECTYCGKGFTRPSSLKVRLSPLLKRHSEKELI
jgi:hypothetical protein